MPEHDSDGDLHGLLKQQRERLISSWGNKIKGIVNTAALPRGELLDHIPAFVDEIIRALYPGAIPLPVSSANAEEHGEQRLRLGFDVAEVVREYGALHEAILELAAEGRRTISIRDEAVIARWVNRGIADAIAQYVSERDAELQRQASEHIGFIAHELRNPLGNALLAFQRLRQAELTDGRMAAMVDRNLRRTAEMIDNVLNHAQLKMGVLPKLAPIALKDLLEDVALDAAVQAEARSITTAVRAPAGLTVEADGRLLRSAISNLVHNAVKFSDPNSTINLTAGEGDGRVTIEVSDGCGGLPPGKAEELFTPLVQRGENRSGFGLGLAIALQAAEAHNGTIRVRDVPGTGCVFIIDLPVLGSPANRS